MPTWYEYSPRDTFLHKLNPVSRLTLIFSLLFLVSFYYDPRYLGVLLVMASAMYHSARVPKKWLLILIPVVGWRLGEFILVGMGQYNPELFKVWPQEVVSRVIFEVHLPIVGDVRMIMGALLWVLGQTLHIVIGILLTLTLIYTTPLNDYVKLMRKFRFPPQITYVMTVALKFVPDIFRMYQSIQVAQRLRGWAVRTKNPIKAAKLALPLMVPLAREIIRYVDRLEISSQLRAFGATTVKYHVELKMTKKDYAVCIVTIVAVIIAMYFLIVHKKGLL